MASLREIDAPCADISPGVAGMEEGESLRTYEKRTKEMVIDECSVRHFLGIQQVLENGELGIVYWLPGRQNPADGMTKVKSERSPLLRLLESGSFNPGMLRPSPGISSK